MANVNRPTLGQRASSLLGNTNLRKGLMAGGTAGLAGKYIYDQTGMQQRLVDPALGALGEAGQGINAQLPSLPEWPEVTKLKGELNAAKAKAIGADVKNRDLANESYMLRGQLNKPPAALSPEDAEAKLHEQYGDYFNRGPLPPDGPPPEKSWGEWAGENALPLGLGAGGLLLLHHYLTQNDRRRDEDKYASAKAAGVMEAMASLRQRLGTGARSLGDKAFHRGMGGLTRAGDLLHRGSEWAGARAGSLLTDEPRPLLSGRVGAWADAHPVATRLGVVAAGTPIATGLAYGAGLFEPPGGAARAVASDSPVPGEKATPPVDGTAAASSMPATPQPPGQPDPKPEPAPGLLDQAGRWIGEHPWQAGGIGLGGLGLMALLSRSDDEDEKRGTAVRTPFFTNRPA